MKTNFLQFCFFSTSHLEVVLVTTMPSGVLNVLPMLYVMLMFHNRLGRSVGLYAQLLLWATQSLIQMSPTQFRLFCHRNNLDADQTCKTSRAQIILFSLVTILPAHYYWTDHYVCHNYDIPLRILFLGMFSVAHTHTMLRPEGNSLHLCLQKLRLIIPSLS
jgi:hypothetical protein